MDQTKLYLGDGAYVREGLYRGEIIISAPRHLTEHFVALGPCETATLLEWMIEKQLISRCHLNAMFDRYESSQEDREPSCD